MLACGKQNRPNTENWTDFQHVYYLTSYCPRMTSGSYWGCWVQNPAQPWHLLSLREVTLGLLSFCHDTNFRVTWEEGNPSKRFLPSVCSVCVCGCQMWESPSHCGWWHPWPGGPGWHMRSTEQVRENKLVKAPFCLKFCPGIPWG